MRQLIANIKKETLILLRDIPGLLILFLMPALLIIVITLTQENAIQSVNKSKVEILFINHDDDEFGEAIKVSLDKSEYFEVIKDYEGKSLNEDILLKFISKGEYKAGIIIPENMTADIISRSKEIIHSEDQDFDVLPDASMIRIYFDPAVKEAFRRSVSNALDMIIQSTEIRFFLRCFFDELPELIDNKADVALKKEINYFIQRTEQEMNSKLKENLGDYAPDYISLDKPDSMNVDLSTILQQSFEIDLSQNISNLAPVLKSYANLEEETLQPSMTQNNVPGFALFAMFFIVIPLAGSIITEKEQGTFTRLKTLPVLYFNILWGKIIAYVVVCFLQFFLMLLIGMFVFPLVFGLPALEIGSQFGMILLATLASGLAAVGFGLIVGSLAGTHNQAAMVGSILVIILSALGGLFMPVYMMPGSLKSISMFSPIRWGTDVYLDIFVRNAGLGSIWMNLLLLILFFVISFVITVWLYSRKQ